MVIFYTILILKLSLLVESKKKHYEKPKLEITDVIKCINSPKYREEVI